eukprot:scaffold6248_cov87-Cylindrotheca_fusiformis.AAC.4
MSSDNQSCEENRHGMRASESQESDQANFIGFLRLPSVKIQDGCPQTTSHARRTVMARVRLSLKNQIGQSPSDS